MPKLRGRLRCVKFFLIFLVLSQAVKKRIVNNIYLPDDWVIATKTIQRHYLSHYKSLASLQYTFIILINFLKFYELFGFLAYINLFFWATDSSIHFLKTNQSSCEMLLYVSTVSLLYHFSVSLSLSPNSMPMLISQHIVIALFSIHFYHIR